MDKVVGQCAFKLTNGFMGQMEDYSVTVCCVARQGHVINSHQQVVLRKGLFHI